MNVAKWLLFALLALPFAELAAFVAVATALGFLSAVALQMAISLGGLMLLRHAGGAHISRVRTALNSGSVTALRADGTGSLTLLAGILLLIPGFITDVVGLVVLLSTLFRGPPPPPPNDGIIDLPPEQWHPVDDPRLTDRSEGPSR
jgi:UPF0716 protein FxsA